MKKYYFLVLLLLSLRLWGQSEFMLKGRVTDEKNAPIANATIRLNEVNAISDEEGFFRIKVPNNASLNLIITCVGFEKKTVTVSSTDNFILLTLDYATDQLKEVKVYAPYSIELQSLPQEHGQVLLAGKKSEVIQVASLQANITEKTGRQLFSKIPGAFIYDMDGAGNQVNMATRGLDPHRSWEYNVRQNGVMTNSDIYGYPASHYSMPMEAIERIEIIRGAASLYYGAQFGGMINYIVKQPDTTKFFNFKSFNSVGSFGMLSTYNQIGGRKGHWVYNAYLSKRVLDGYRESGKSDYNAHYAAISYVANRVHIKAEMGHSEYLYQLPGALTDAQFTENPRQAVRTRNYYSPNIYVPSLSLEWDISSKTHLSWVNSAILGTRKSILFNQLANVVDAKDANGNFAARQYDIDYYESLTSELSVKHRYKFGGNEHTLVAAVRGIKNDLHRQQLGTGTNGTTADFFLASGDFKRDLHFLTSNVAFYLENIFRITPALSISPGIRFEEGVTDMAGRIDYLETKDVPNQIVHKFPLLGINTEYKPNENIRIYGGWSQAYRPVIFGDIIPGNLYEKVDKNLKDAYGYNAEMGVNGQTERFTYSLGGFLIKYKNRMGKLVQKEGTTTYLYRTNIGNSLTKGIEAYIEYKLLRTSLTDIGIFTSTSLMDGRYTSGSISNGKENVAITGNKLETVPRWISRNGLQLRYKTFFATVLYSYVSEMYSDALNTISTPSGAVGIVPAYSLVDINTAWRLSKFFTLKAGVNNLLDTSYYTKRPNGYPGPGIWPSDGRSFIGSVIFSL